ncbi:hypothetical protein CFC21_086003 [Triticum aestivum]|uniref:Uncharacterized protein n=3 Tax=Triticum TaxID=4564 RepID=A0A9R1B661_TRITD|nr:uncharacterized protein LOC123135447 [Triticum aestivum]KAF7082123.1 hypothetical protein CFC21_086003 [Triticum aestivum]VAI52821.1 unnamed protein product [Triticum turgidum subsp. durum]
MLRLRGCILVRLLSSPATSQGPPLHRPLSAAAAPAVSPNPSFVVDDYLVSTCGLTRAQALKASAKLSHLKSPTKPDAVLAFLAGLGVSAADVASLVAKDPLFLCASAEKTLAPVVVELAGLGLSHSEIARLVPLSFLHFRSRSIVSKLQYYLPLFGSSENLFRVLKLGYLAGADIEGTVKPNVALLRQCGLDDCDITKLSLTKRGVLSSKPERVGAMVACAEGLGVPRGSGMFRHALDAVGFIGQEKIAAKVAYLKKTFRWSDAEVSIALRKAPCVLRKSKELLQRRSDFLISEVGLEPSYIAQRSVIINYKLEGRMKPRYYVVKFLMENGLLKCKPGYYYTAFKVREKVFMEKFICPHKEVAPHLSEDYARACEGVVPARFRFT